MICDLSCFLGEWPFRSLPASGLDAMKQMAERNGIERAAVSAFEEIFWKDGFEATRRVAEQIRGESWLVPFQVVNPRFGGWERDVARGVEELRVRGFRLVPGYHGYDLNDSGVADLLAAARQHNLPVIVHVRIQDERMHWPTKFPPVPAEQVNDFLARSAGVRVTVAGCELGEIGKIADAMSGRDDVWVDWSRLRAMLFGLDKLLEVVSADQVVYGSLWPLQVPSAMLNLVHASRLDDGTRRAVCWENAQRLVIPDHARGPTRPMSIG